MPIATRGAVKNISPDEIHDLKASIILSNTYHLLQRPGLDVLKKHKGLHHFMQWNKPILTDSGGFQVFSLAKIRKITPEGAVFQSEIDGSRITLTPEKAIDAQFVIGSDIMMVLDECTPYPCTYEYAKKSLAITLQWAARSKRHFEKTLQKKKIPDTKRPLIFGIVQGSVFRDLREEAVAQLVKIGFDGYAIGGVAVGEGMNQINEIVNQTCALLPKDTPRYLMGVGKPDDIKHAVHAGVDMFDCVIPTREARHGRLYVRTKPVSAKKFYTVLNIKKEIFKKDLNPVDKKCSCLLCAQFTRSYIRHLFSINEGLALRLATLHNLNFYFCMMKEFQEQKDA
jgi:queuine tRNA-ribosyltransferase